MRDFREKIPGWLDAVREERQCHDMAFAAPHDMVCGQPVRHMSLVDICRMTQIDSPFFGNKFPQVLLFRLSPEVRRAAGELVAYQHIDYAPRRRFRFSHVRRKVERMPPDHLAAEVSGYISRTFWDTVNQTGHPRKNASHWSGIVDYVDLVGEEYGWTVDHTMNMPYRQLIQLVRRILYRRDPRQSPPSAADAKIAAYTRSKRRKKS